MFEWISDAVEWISEGISSLWDDTVGSVVNTVTDAIWDVMFEWIFDLIFDGISDIFEFINMSAADIFTLSWVQAFISLFHSFGYMLFVVGMLAAIFDTAVAYENGSANIKNTCINVIKGFMAASLFAVVPPLLYQFCISLQSTFSNDLLSSLIAVPTISLAAAGLNIISSLAGNISLYSLFFMILFGYCVIKVIFANIKRGGILLCQIAVGSLYMFGVPRGYTDGFSSWCRQVIATCLTAFLQTTILYLGLLTYTQNALLAVGICLSATEVPRVAQMYGLDTGTKINMVGISSTVSMGARIAKFVKNKA